MKNVNTLRDLQEHYENEMDRKHREHGSDETALEDINGMFEAYRRAGGGESTSRSVITSMSVDDADVLRLTAVNEALIQQNTMLMEKLKR